MTIATETMTISLPIQQANRLRRVAQIAHRPIDQVIAQTLQFTLPPILDDLPEKFHTALLPLENWSTEELRQQVFATLNSERVERYDELLDLNSAGTLTSADNEELDQLRQEADLIMYKKAYAALLLKWRGERVPTLAELDAASE